MRFLHIRTLLQRDSALKARNLPPAHTGVFERLNRMWGICVASLFLDSIAIALQSDVIPSDQSYLLAIVCVLIILPFINQRAPIRALSTLRRIQRSPQKNFTLILRTLSFFIITGLVCIKLLLLPTLDNYLALLVTVILFIGVATSIHHFIRDTRKHAQDLKEQPWLSIRFWEHQLIVVFAFPMIMARTISLIGAISIHSAEARMGFLLTSLLILLTLRPQRLLFLGSCAQCKRPTSLAFVEYGSCPHCNDTLLSHRT